jgi:DNA end-binding protein Ku
VVEEAPERPEVSDLMAALEASVKEARSGRKASSSSSSSSSSGGKAGGRAKGKGRASSGKGKAAADDERSREELYEEAQRRKVPGRSKMSRDELAQALAEAS